MGGALILETTYLVDLEREIRRGDVGAARRFLDRHAQERLYITPTIAGELAAGSSLAQLDRWNAFVRPFRMLETDGEVAWRYGQLYRYLRENGLLIGSNDLWIAASGLVHEMPVVTRNERHYRQVPGLVVIGYES